MWDLILDKLNNLVRLKQHKNKHPTLLIIDSRSNINSDVPRSDLIGYDGGKKIKGIKEFILTDTLGLIWQVLVTLGNVGERA